MNEILSSARAFVRLITIASDADLNAAFQRLSSQINDRQENGSDPILGIRDALQAECRRRKEDQF